MISIKDYEKILYNKSDNTKRAYLSHIRKFLKWASKNKKTIDQYTVIEYIEQLKSSSTKNQSIAAIRLYLVQSNEKINLLKSVPSISKPRTHLNGKDQDSLLRARMNNFYDIRNQILIRLMLRGGLRISEALGLKLEDIDLKDRSIKIRGKHVKRGKSRIAFIDEDTAKLIKFYVRRDKIVVKKSKLFNIKAPAFRRAFKQYLRISGLDKHLSPHSLRHTYAIHYMQSGGKIDKLKKLMGHENINTTSIYLNYTDDELKEEYDKIHK